MTTAVRLSLLGALLLAPCALPAQQTPPVSESVVVTATSLPEEEKQVGSAVTVITRKEIEKSGKTSVLELLRSVPGLDVVQSGTPGSLTSALHPRRQLHADTRARGRRPHEFPVLRGLRSSRP